MQIWMYCNDNFDIQLIDMTLIQSGVKILVFPKDKLLPLGGCYDPI